MTQHELQQWRQTQQLRISVANNTHKPHRSSFCASEVPIRWFTGCCANMSDRLQTLETAPCHSKQSGGDGSSWLPFLGFALLDSASSFSSRSFHRRTCSWRIFRKRVFFCSSLSAFSTSGSMYMSFKICCSMLEGQLGATGPSGGRPEGEGTVLWRAASWSGWFILVIYSLMFSYYYTLSWIKVYVHSHTPLNTLIHSLIHTRTHTIPFQLN